MAQVVTTISINEEAKELGHKASKMIYGSEKKFSLYVQELIKEDCKQRNIK